MLSGLLVQYIFKIFPYSNVADGLPNVQDIHAWIF